MSPIIMPVSVVQIDFFCIFYQILCLMCTCFYLLRPFLPFGLLLIFVTSGQSTVVCGGTGGSRSMYKEALN